MGFAYRPGEKNRKSIGEPAPEVPWPVKGEHFDINGETWFVCLFEEGMNMVEIDVPDFKKPARFFTIADWKQIWS